MTDQPDWMNPANDRKTTFTDEEIDEFVDDYIHEFKDIWEDLKLKLGKAAARQKIKDGFISQDENNLLNIEPSAEIH